MSPQSPAKTSSHLTGALAWLALPFGAKGSGARAFGSRRALLAVPLALLALLLPAVAQAAIPFGLEEFRVSFSDSEGEALTQAGSHPFEQVVELRFNSESNEIEEAAKDVITALPAGFIGNPTAVPTCAAADFLISATGCPDSSALGYATTTLAASGSGKSTTATSPIYNLAPAPGKAAKLGFWVINVPITIELGTESRSPYRIAGGATGISQVLEVLGSSLHIWGVPAAKAHDKKRGKCLESGGTCPANVSVTPFLTMPRACAGPLRTEYAADSWQHSGVFLADGLPDLDDPNWFTGSDESSDSAGNPIGLSGCGRLGLAAGIEAQPTTESANSPSGLDFGLNVQNDGIENPEGVSGADVAKTVVTLPSGFTVNPAVAEGLAVCSEAQFEASTPYLASGEGPNFAPPGVSCPEASRIGTVEVETPVLEGKLLKGSIYQAAPYSNPFGTFVALYMVIREPGLGLVFGVPIRVDSDPATGRITTTADDLPPYPFSHFRLHFREGARSPLATPPACGNHTIEALLYPSTGAAPVPASSSFEIRTGSGGGACPSGTPPFHPNLVAGTVNNMAGSYSPFNVKLTRTDAEQEITHFSIKLPPGVAGKLAGVSVCSEAQIAQAQGRTGPHGGAEELASPSCPANSQVGRTLAGAGVGGSLAYASGKLYLAGPYHGKPLSIVSITSGVVGPFDIGTVVVRLAIDVNPETGEVFLDSTGSDPIPHIVKGIPVHLRDIRAYTDRPGFTFNPTSCDPTFTAATVLGSGTDFVSTADDNPFVSPSPFQAADCASLPYKPRLQLKLKGPTKRGGNPQLTAILWPRPGDANSKSVSVALPHSEFLDQSHIGTICTRVQFKQAGGNGEACPAASIYGKVAAYTPLLDEPLVGNIYLRSSEHPLPDLVLSLHGLIDFHAVGRIDSVNGGIRNTFDFVPDAPISKVEVSFGAGRKSLLENSTSLCRGSHKATAEYTAHNGRTYSVKVPLQAKCRKPKPKQAKRAKGAKARAALRALRAAW